MAMFCLHESFLSWNIVTWGGNIFQVKNWRCSI
nr:MAG TPA: hypothetical protein [Caudoviricetes sp.]